MASQSKKSKIQYLLGKRVRQLRLEKKMSLRGLSQKCDLDYSDIGKYEKGEVNIQLSTIYELAKGLEVHPKSLFDFDISFEENID
jgi:transcriptional regulator with XRE-family HTH domain